MIDKSNGENLNNTEQCDSCLYERVICLQEGECLLHKLKIVEDNNKYGKNKFN